MKYDHAIFKVGCNNVLLKMPKFGLDLWSLGKEPRWRVYRFT